MALASNTVKKRGVYINEEQKNMLIEFMCKYPELQRGKFCATFTYKHAQKLRQKVTEDLHQIPGAVKDWKQWRKTWQDMRSCSKAKTVLIKKHANQSGGGPASSQVLTQIDQNVLALMGSTVVKGHKTVQESIVQFEWLDDSNICDVDNDEDEGNFPICNNQKILQHFMPQESLSLQICSTSKENYLSKESLSNNNYYYNDDSQNSLNIKTTTLEAPITATTNNASHCPVTPSSNSISNKRVRRISAAQRYDKSIEQTENLTIISQKDSEIRELYYAKKLKLYEMEIALKERDVIAKENIYTLLKQLKKKQSTDML